MFYTLICRKDIVTTTPAPSTTIVTTTPDPSTTIVSFSEANRMIRTIVNNDLRMWTEV